MEPMDSGLSAAFELVSGIILLPAEADGERGWMALDTGAMQTALNTKYFSHPGGNRLEIAKFSGQMERAAAAETVLESLTLPGIMLREQPAIRMDFSYVEDSLRPELPEIRFLGVLGIDVIGRFSVQIDYGEKRLIWNPPPSFRGARCVPLRMEALPVVELETAGTPHRFVLDTGANTCLLSDGLQGVLPTVPHPDTSGLYLVPSMRLAGQEYRDIAAVFTDLSQIQRVVQVDGVIGYQILSHRRPFFDFANGLLFLADP